ncbi:unnamed protein product [Tilletia controversa]|nr:unnamed protein product [Tilletia controversa]
MSIQPDKGYRCDLCRAIGGVQACRYEGDPAVDNSVGCANCKTNKVECSFLHEVGWRHQPKGKEVYIAPAEVLFRPLRRKRKAAALDGGGDGNGNGRGAQRHPAGAHAPAVWRPALELLTEANDNDRTATIEIAHRFCVLLDQQETKAVVFNNKSGPGDENAPASAAETEPVEAVDAADADSDTDTESDAPAWR